MIRKLRLALSGAILTVVLALAGVAAAASRTSVMVRVEGKSRTLLAPVSVKPHSGWITKGGTPHGTCPATSAAGALDVATHHKWRGSYNSQFGELAITSILGSPNYPLSPKTPYYWSIWVNNAYAQSGVCDIKLHKGEQLLFALEPNSATLVWYPLGLSAPHKAVAGHAFKVKVVWFSMAGKRKPLAGATVTGSGVSTKTNPQGIATVTATHAGKLVLDATSKNYIRSAPVRVIVTG